MGTLRYLKVTLISGALTALLAAGLFELHVFSGLDATLAGFLARPSPPVVDRGLQYFLILLFSFGIAWTTIDLNRILYTQAYRDPNNQADPTSANARYRGCDREAYAGPNYWDNAGRPTVYYTDAYGHVVKGATALAPGLIRQQVSAVTWNANSTQYKLHRPYCAPGVRAPN